MMTFLIVLAWIVGFLALTALFLGMLAGAVAAYEGDVGCGAVVSVGCLLLMALLVTVGINTGAFGNDADHCRAGTVYREAQQGKSKDWWCEAR